MRSHSVTRAACDNELPCAAQVRSQHFFEAAGVVAELRASLARTYEQVLDMRAAVRAVDRDVVQAARPPSRRVPSCPLTLLQNKCRQAQPVSSLAHSDVQPGYCLRR